MQRSPLNVTHNFSIKMGLLVPTLFSSNLDETSHFKVFPRPETIASSFLIQYKLNNLAFCQEVDHLKEVYFGNKTLTFAII